MSKLGPLSLDPGFWVRMEMPIHVKYLHETGRVICSYCGDITRVSPELMRYVSKTVIVKLMLGHTLGHYYRGHT